MAFVLIFSRNLEKFYTRRGPWHSVSCPYTSVCRNTVAWHFKVFEANIFRVTVFCLDFFRLFAVTSISSEIWEVRICRKLAQICKKFAQIQFNLA